MNLQSAPVKRIGIVANMNKPAASELAPRAVEALRSKAHVAVQRRLAETISCPELAADDAEIRTCDAVIAFGGDGTMLATSRLVAPYGTPILGVNLGRFGFLNEVAPEMVGKAMQYLLDGNYCIEERLMLEAFVMHGSEVVSRDIALNELVIGHATLARILHLTMAINGSFVTTYDADGIILATPTGSTAYSLSAGGPLVHPELNVIVVTPICAHTLTTRTLVIPESHEIQVNVERQEGEETQITIDGQRKLPMSHEDMLRVKRAPFRARIITNIGGASFYDKLRTKLRWGEQVAY